MTARWNTIISVVLGLVALIVFVIGLVARVSLSSFVTLAVIAVATCVIGNTLSATRFGWTSSTYWTHPLSIIGMILGAASLALVVLTFVGVTGTSIAFTVLGIIVFVKVGLKIWQNAVLT